jgi:hypothetical protein
MPHRFSRRGFLHAAAVAGLAGVRPVARAAGAADVIRFGPDLEPVVRLIEDTPRADCVAALVDQLRRGLPYRRFLAAVFLAAIRKRNPHHSVYLVHSAHQVSLDLGPRDRLVPLFWAVDHFKWQQEISPTGPVERLTGSLPAADKAAAEFHAAMQRLDAEKAERAAVALARADGARQAFDLFWHYGCRDSSFIGHRAIGVTNSRRALDAIGWRHAEPVLRFVVQDLHSMGGKPDRHYQPNVARADRAFVTLPAGWAVGRADAGATRELFAQVRRGQSEAACDLVIRQLSGDFGARPAWDALHVAAAELLMLHAAADGMAGRPLHLNTTVNALHYAFRACGDARTRLLILLQATAWAAEFIRTHLGEQALAAGTPLDLGGLSAGTVDDVFARLPPHTYHYDVKTRTGPGTVIADLATRRDVGRGVFALVSRDPDAALPYMQAARDWLCTKATVEAHEFKLPAALFEDYDVVSPEWRPRLLAASAHWLHGRQSPDSPLLRQAREAVGKL